MSRAHDAARSGDSKLLEEALNEDEDAIASRDKLQRTPLHLASWAGHTSLVAMLITRGADVHAEAVDGFRAIHFAAQNGHESTVKELLKVNLNSRHSFNAWTHLCQICSQARSKVNVRDSKKLNTPLHLAASKGHADTAAYLLKKNADPTSFNRARLTPVDVAATQEVRKVFLSSAETTISSEDFEDGTHADSGRASTGNEMPSKREGAEMLVGLDDVAKGKNKKQKI